jgi:pimeloyl-ACP methyl ester carboxylesterase
MRTPITAVLMLAMTIFATSCSQVRGPSQIWDASERLAVGREQDGKIKDPTTGVTRIEVHTVEKLSSVPMDPETPLGRKFELYYFVRMPTDGRAQKNVLFCAGGPGLIVSGPLLSFTFADFLTQNGYNVVFFHPRGAGFSQIPPANEYDQYLKTSYVVEDIEAIRQDFLGKDGKWDAIIGWSYGTVIAQQYAHLHAAEVDRLMLIGPMSRDKFKSSPDAFDELSEAVRATNRKTLQKIFDQNPSDFPNLTDELKTTIIDTAFGTKNHPGVYDRAENVFGSVQWLVDFYCKPKTQEELKKSGLNRYSPEFFNRLRLLRMFGWLPLSVDHGMQIDGAKIIVNEVLSSDNYRCSGEDTEEPVGSSRRVFNVVGVYDGINDRFLNQWIKNGKQRIRDALRESEGEAHLNDLEKVGIGDSDSLKPWDPADYGHNKPTLILEGGADTVSAGGQAKRFYLDALTGDRTLIEFRGIGHQFGLPQIPATKKPMLTGTVRLKPPPIQPGETRAVLGTYSGRTLDENFRFKLEGNTLEPSLKLTGLGILENVDARDVRNQEPNVVALIENTGDSSVNGDRLKWTISNKLFRGGVHLDPPPIDPGKTSEVYGTIDESWADHVIHFKKPDGLEEDLEVICVRVVVVTDPFTKDKKTLLEFWFRNNSLGQRDGKRREWLVSNGNFGGTVAFEPGRIESKQVVARRATLPLGFEVDTETTPIDPEVESVERLKGCLPPKQLGNEETKIAVKNDRPDAFDGANHKWQIKNPMARWSIEVDPPLLQGNGGGEKVPATNIKVEEWKYPMLSKPANLEHGLEFRGYNIEGADKVSVLLRSSQILANPVGRDWVYIDPNESPESACFQVSTSLDCLIYSFLVMGPEAFNNEEDNKIIGIVRGFGATVCHRNRDGQGPRNSVGDSCP